MEVTDLVQAEFHCHTIYSKDSLVLVEKLAEQCRDKGLQRLVITDHNTIEGAQSALSIDPYLFIVGEEIMTLQGELLAVFVSECVPPGLPASEAIEILRSQGAFISVSHPFDTARSGHWDENNLIKILPMIDAIEVFNSRCIVKDANKQALEFADHHHLSMTVGSDSHTLGEIGMSTLYLPDFNDADSLRHSLKAAELKTKMSSPFVHFYSSYARWKKTRR